MHFLAPGEQGKLPAWEAGLKGGRLTAQVAPVWWCRCECRAQLAGLAARVVHQHVTVTALTAHKWPIDRAGHAHVPAPMQPPRAIGQTGRARCA